MTQTVSLSPVERTVFFSPKTAVCLRSLEAVRAEKTVHAVYFCQGSSQMEAWMRLIELHGLGIINLAKLSSDHSSESALKKEYAAEDQMIIIFSADAKEIARFPSTSIEGDFRKWVSEEGSKLLLAHK